VSALAHTIHSEIVANCLKMPICISSWLPCKLYWIYTYLLKSVKLQWLRVP